MKIPLHPPFSKGETIRQLFAKAETFAKGDFSPILRGDEGVCSPSLAKRGKGRFYKIHFPVNNKT